MPVYEGFYRDGMRRIESLLPGRRYASGGCVAVVVNCRIGMHRSVAMAERMARRVRGWEGVRVVVEHLDTDVVRGVRRGERLRVGVHGG